MRGKFRDRDPPQQLQLNLGDCLCQYLLFSYQSRFEHLSRVRSSAMLLNNFSQKPEMGEESSLQQVHSVDRGRKAWTFLAAASATNVITYGEYL